MALTERLGIAHPVLPAPMDGVAGGRLRPNAGWGART